MTTNEQKILEIIWNWGGEARVDIIARESGMSIEYARLLCEELGKKDYVDFLHTKLCKIKSKGKSAIAKNYTQKPKKIVVAKISGKFGLGKDKKGRMILGY